MQSSKSFRATRHGDVKYPTLTIIDTRDETSDETDEEAKTARNSNSKKKDSPEPEIVGVTTALKPIMKARTARKPKSMEEPPQPQIVEATTAPKPIKKARVARNSNKEESPKSETVKPKPARNPNTAKNDVTKPKKIPTKRQARTSKNAPKSQEKKDGDEDTFWQDVDPQNRIRATITRYDDEDKNRVQWDDIAGLEEAKNSLKENLISPSLRPDIFSGLRAPGTGILLLGSPGTGKSMLAQAVATEAKSTFFSLSASTLMSREYGGNERLVRGLFKTAKRLAPSIIFIDEIDSLLSQRGANSTEHEASRSTKNEFLQFWTALQPAVASKGDGKGRVFILGATNFPWDIDQAALRRFAHCLYIPLPDSDVRERQLRTLLGCDAHELTDADFERLGHETEGN